MRCEKFDKLINLLLDGRLDQNEESELKAHLSECKRCQAKLSLLQSAEETAKKIETTEPPQEYWDTFSARVREKIIAREERTPIVRLRRALENILTFSPLKIKIAAGLVSVVLVFVIGKLYVDYRGKEIVPSEPVIVTFEEPRPYAPEIQKKEAFLEEEDRNKLGPLPEEREMELMEYRKVRKEEIERETEAPAKAISPPKTERPPEPQSIPPEGEPAGAGVEEGAAETVVIKMAAPKGRIQETEGIHQKGEAEQLTTIDISLPPPTTGFRTYLSVDHYLVNKDTLPKIDEDDTLMQIYDLRRIIHVWKTYIEENPGDSLINQGYLQVATACYLLAKLSQDSTIISDGSKLIEEYLNQIKEPVVEENLSEKLKKLKALRKR